MTRTAKTYGGALYDLARSEQLDDAILQDVSGVMTVFDAHPDYMRLLCTPSIPKEERRGLLEEAFGAAVHPYVLSFMKLLCDNGTLRELPGCAREYRRRHHADHGIMEVCAVTAVPMKPELQEKLRARIESLTGKTVELTSRVEESILGGVRLELPDRQLDGTVAYHLEEIQRILRNTVI